ncbi:hypothetical protein [Chitinimonas sp.]|uniref:hypothetical protein n=1 Tax=Chitinimonas sp. TaxID=1934313 RepID=UPI0035B30C9D
MRQVSNHADDSRSCQPDRLRRLLLGMPLLLAWPAHSEAAALVIARPDESPTPMMLDIQQRILAAYRQLGVRAVVHSLPPKRSAAYALADKVDAELLRVQLTAARNAFLRVETPLVRLQVMALTHGRELPLSGIQALRDYKVVIPAGIQALEDVASHARTVEAVPDYDSGIRMLVQGRADIALQLAANPASLLAEYRAVWQAQDVRVSNNQLAEYTAYHFISPRHRALLPPLADAFHAQGLPIQP